MNTYAPLRQPGFPLFLASLFISTIGTQAQLRAIGWQIQHSFEDTVLLLGLIGLAEAIPAVGLALIGGWLADLVDRKRLMLAALAVMLACSTALWALTPWAYTADRLWLIYAVVAVGGLARAALIPSRSAIGIDLVPRELITRAVTLRSFAWMTAAAIGPLLVGPAIAVAGTRGAFALDIACMIAAIACAMVMRYRRPPPPPREPMLAGVRAGIAFVRGDRMMLGAMSLDLFAVLFGGATALLPAFADDILHTDAFGYGLLCAAQEVGAILMAVALAHAPPVRRAGATMLIAVAVFGACMIGFALSPWLWLSVGLLFVSGLADTVSVVIRSTIIQVRTPSHLRGRVASVNAIFVGSSNEIGAFESGVAARLLGLVASVVVGGVITVGIVGMTALRVPALRRLGRVDQHIDGDEAGRER